MGKCTIYIYVCNVTFILKKFFYAQFKKWKKERERKEVKKINCFLCIPAATFIFTNVKKVKKRVRRQRETRDFPGRGQNSVGLLYFQERNQDKSLYSSAFVFGYFINRFFYNFTNKICVCHRVYHCTMFLCDVKSNNDDE